jgi:starch synthase (maltosyl-transferring)
VVVVVNLDPHSPQESDVHLDPVTLGLPAPAEGHDPWAPSFVAHDELSGESYGWGENVYVRLEPLRQVAHVVHVVPS